MWPGWRPDVVGEAINLGHTAGESGQLLAMLEDALGRKAIIEQQPGAGDMPVTCADLAKASRLLGYRPHVPWPTA